MKLGKKALEALQAEIDGRLMPGDELIVAGPVAAEGTAWITKNYHDRLREFFAERFLEDAVKLPEVYGTGTENDKIWKMAEESGASARYRMGEGGFLAALWKMAEASQVGLEMDFTTSCVDIASVIGVKDIKVQQKMWYGWKTVLTSPGAENQNEDLFCASLTYPDAVNGKTYRVTCVHYANYDVYEEVENDTVAFKFVL